jgi:hypothetical protein
MFGCPNIFPSPTFRGYLTIVKRWSLIKSLWMSPLILSGGYLTIVKRWNLIKSLWMSPFIRQFMDVPNILISRLKIFIMGGLINPLDLINNLWMINIFHPIFVPLYWWLFNHSKEL